ncbi:hypothetical protein HK405_010755, partial [Cladochytrium tenue]
MVALSEDYSDEAVAEALDICGAPVSVSELVEIKSEAGVSEEGLFSKLVEFVKTAVSAVGMEGAAKALESLADLPGASSKEVEVTTTAEETAAAPEVSLTALAPPVMVGEDGQQIIADTANVVTITVTTTTGTDGAEEQKSLDVPAFAQSGWWSKLIAAITRRHPGFAVDTFVAMVALSEDYSDEAVAEALDICGAPVSAAELVEIKSEAGISEEGLLSKLVEFLKTAVNAVGMDGAVKALESLADLPGASTEEVVVTTTAEETAAAPEVSLTALAPPVMVGEDGQQIVADTANVVTITVTTTTGTDGAEEQKSLDVPAFAQSSWWSKLIAAITRRHPDFAVDTFVAMVALSEDFSDEAVAEALDVCGASVSVAELAEIKSEAGISEEGLFSKLVEFVKTAVSAVGMEGAAKALESLADLPGTSSKEVEVTTTAEETAVAPEVSLTALALPVMVGEDGQQIIADTANVVTITVTTATGTDGAEEQKSLDVPAFAQSGWWSKLIAAITRRYPGFAVDTFVAMVALSEDFGDEAVAEALDVCGAPVSVAELTVIKSEVGISEEGLLAKLIGFVKTAVDMVGMEAAMKALETLQSLGPDEDEIQEDVLVSEADALPTKFFGLGGSVSSEHVMEIPEFASNDWWARLLAVLQARSSDFEPETFASVLALADEVDDDTVLDALGASGVNVDKQGLAELKTEAGLEEEGVFLRLLTFLKTLVNSVGSSAAFTIISTVDVASSASSAAAEAYKATFVPGKVSTEFYTPVLDVTAPPADTPVDVPAYAQGSWWRKLVSALALRYPDFSAETFVAVLAISEEVNDSSITDAFEVAGAAVSTTELDEIKAEAGCSDEGVLTKLLTFVRTAVNTSGMPATLKTLYQLETIQTAEAPAAATEVVVAVEAGVSSDEPAAAAETASAKPGPKSSGWFTRLGQ